MLDYIVSLREGIMDAWSGIVMALRASDKRKWCDHSHFRIMLIASAEQLLLPYVESIFQLLQSVYNDPNRTEALLRSSMGVLGYVSQRTLMTCDEL